MGKYRTTLNMAEGRRGTVVELKDSDERVLNMVLAGHLVPVKISEAAEKRIAAARSGPKKIDSKSPEAIKKALAERRAANAAKLEGSSVSVVAPTTEEAPKAAASGPLTTSSVLTAGAPEPEKEEFTVELEEPVAPKPKTGSRRSTRSKES